MNTNLIIMVTFWYALGSILTYRKLKALPEKEAVAYAALQNQIEAVGKGLYLPLAGFLCGFAAVAPLFELHYFFTEVCFPKDKPPTQVLRAFPAQLYPLEVGDQTQFIYSSVPGEDGRADHSLLIALRIPVIVEEATASDAWVCRVQEDTQAYEFECDEEGPFVGPTGNYVQLKKGDLVLVVHVEEHGPRFIVRITDELIAAGGAY